MFVVLLEFSRNKSRAGQLMDAHKAWIERGLDDSLRRRGIRDAVGVAHRLAPVGPDIGHRFTGRAQVRDAFTDVFTSMPDANWGDGRHFVISDDYGVSEWRLTGTLPDGREHDIKIQILGDSMFEVQPLYAGGSQHNRIQIFSF